MITLKDSMRWGGYHDSLSAIIMTYTTNNSAYFIYYVVHKILMNEQSQISRTYKQDIGSNGIKEDIVCWYVRLIFDIRLSTADILPTIIMVFVVV